jgi:hypothetical protein
VLDIIVSLALRCSFTVPIYDARLRSDFAFDARSLQLLDQLPRFKDGKTDPGDNRYMVTVGYGVSSWSRNARMGEDPQFCVSLNILFLVILGKTKRDGPE